MERITLLCDVPGSQLHLALPSHQARIELANLSQAAAGSIETFVEGLFGWFETHYPAAAVDGAVEAATLWLNACTVGA